MQKDKIGLAQLVQRFEADPTDTSLRDRIVIHPELIDAIKSRKDMAKSIFTYEFLSSVIDNVNHQNEEHAQQLSSLKFDPSGQNVPICYSLPFSSTEILCCDCQHISDLLLAGQEDKPPLLPRLLAFLQQPPHYLLSVYFSKIMCAITKRISNHTHKYNKIFTDWVFGPPVLTDSHQQIDKETEKIVKSPKIKQNILPTNQHIKIETQDTPQSAKKQQTDQQKSTDHAELIRQSPSTQSPTKKLTSPAKSQVSLPNYSCSLMKSINHLYSPSTIDYATRWLLMGRRVIRGPDQQSKTSSDIDYCKDIKEIYLSRLVELVNTNSMSKEYLDNIPHLFLQMLINNNSKIPTAFKLVPIVRKFTLYELATNQIHVLPILAHPQNGTLNSSKIMLVKIIIARFIVESDKLDNNPQAQNQEAPTLRLLDIITSEHLSQIVQWIVWNCQRIMHLKHSKCNDSQQVKPVKVILQTEQKTLIVQLLELLHELQRVKRYRPSLIEYYDSNSTELVHLMISLALTNNNLIQLALHKVLMQVLKQDNAKSRSSIHVAFQFAHKLLTGGIIKLIDHAGVRQHAVLWAQLILNYEKQHIFEDSAQEMQWDHVREIVQQAKELQVGVYRLNPSILQVHNTKDKAKIKYAKFMSKEIEIIYEEKQIKNTLTSRKNLEETIIPQNQTLSILIEPYLEQPVIPLQDLSPIYLQYDVDSLIAELP